MVEKFASDLEVEERPLSSRYRMRYFFVLMSLAIVIIALLGFVPSYAAPRPRPYPLHWFSHLHGALMSGWLLAFVVQTWLVAKGNVKLHRVLGPVFVVLGVLVFISMGVISVVTLVADNPPREHWLWDVLLVQLYPMLVFGLFFGWAVWARKKPDVHKRLMLLGTLVLVQAAIDRIPWLRIGISFFVYMDVLVCLLIIYDLVTLRRIHKVTWISALIIVVAQICVDQIWGSSWWHAFWFDMMNKLR